MGMVQSSQGRPVILPSDNGRAKDQLHHANGYTDDDEHDDNPGNGVHLGVGDGIGQDLRQVQDDSAALIQDLDAQVDFEVLADRHVERMQRWF